MVQAGSTSKPVAVFAMPRLVDTRVAAVTRDTELEVREGGRLVFSQGAELGCARE
ncbi:hypothetical protein [Kribbella turkmenica]|uniref:hypothetical protein n=1 Tax=Kribbella turkmenica TaxID=2530375 RepID=UPI001404B69D|nr:hypothetical protein [Kribbella turkmenica]